MMRYVPNILSGIRLILACVFPFTSEHIWVWLVVASGLSDFLDGWIARRWHVTSWQGGLLDAVADKAFVLVVLIVMAGQGRFPFYFVPVLLARDITVAFAALYALVERLWYSFQQMDARWSGKIATGGQFFLFGVVLVVPYFTLPVLGLAALCSLGAAFDYGWLFVKAVRERARST